MEKLENNSFVKEGRYINPLSFNEGFIVSRAYSPMGYKNKKEEDESAWLPEIILCKPNDCSSVKVTGRGIVAKSPTKYYGLQFYPDWNEKKEENKVLIYRFKEAFIPEEKDEIGDIIVLMYNLSGFGDDNIVSGQIPYSGIDNRNITLHGQRNELEKMIKLASSNFPERNYALEFGEYTAKGNKKYNIKIGDEELNKFAKAAIEKLSLYPSFL